VSSVPSGVKRLVRSVLATVAVAGLLSAASAPERFADAIRKVGPQFCILSSDLGQKGNPLPPDGFGEFLAAMRARGFSEQELDRMSKQNPARLLGLQ
jgi:predicted metal-dependent TIM-barrel fold hydrolase